LCGVQEEDCGAGLKGTIMKSAVLAVGTLLIGLLISLLLGLWLHFKPLVRWRLRGLTSASLKLHAENQLDRSLAAACAAEALARAELRVSPTHMYQLVYLASVHAASGQHDQALKVLEEAEALLPTTPPRVPELLDILMTRASVLEAARRMKPALEALERARELRKSALGPRSLDYGYSCFSVACAIVRYANEASTETPSQRAELLERAVVLALEAGEAADASFDSHQGDEWAEEVLKLVESGSGPDALVALSECAPHIARLREHLEDHFEHFGGPDVPSPAAAQ